MSAKKLQRWYQQVWSGFTQALENGEIGKDNLQVNQQGERQEIAVPIFEEKNMDPQMAVDEKTINGICYNVLSNRQTRKIASMAVVVLGVSLRALCG